MDGASRALLVLPHVVALLVLAIPTFVAVVCTWFVALVTGWPPAWAAHFLIGTLAWQARVQAYLLLLTDRCPPFTLRPDAGAVRIEVPLVRMDRPTVLFRLVLLVPVYVVNNIMTTGALLASVPAWIVTLVLGRLPEPIFYAFAAVERFALRAGAYWMVLTESCPFVRGLGELDTDRPPLPEGTTYDAVATRPLRVHGRARVCLVAIIVVGCVGTAASGRFDQWSSQRLAFHDVVVSARRLAHTLMRGTLAPGDLGGRIRRERRAARHRQHHRRARPPLPRLRAPLPHARPLHRGRAVRQGAARPAARRPPCSPEAGPAGQRHLIGGRAWSAVRCWRT